jgi:hypothetical protein
MTWLSNILSKVGLKGVTSTRLASVVVGSVLLAWLYVCFLTGTLPDIPPTVLGLLLVVVGTLGPTPNNS